MQLNVKYATVCKHSLKALLVAFEFYSPIFFRLPVCECPSALSQLFIGVYNLRVFFFAGNLLCNLTCLLELLFLRYAIATPFDISPSIFYETWLRTLKFRKLQKRPGALKTMFCLVQYNPLLNITSCKLQSRPRQQKKFTCIMFHRGRDKRDLREIISKAPNFNERA